MTWLFKLLVYWQTLVLVLTPLILLPLSFVPGTESKCGYTIIVMAIYWMTEALPLGITALIPIVLFPMMGILDAEQTASSYVQVMITANSIDKRAKRMGLQPSFKVDYQPKLVADRPINSVTAKLLTLDLLMLFVGGLIVALAVESVNLHKRIALRILTMVGSQPRWLMLGVMGTTFFLSMWISNTASTAMMLPIVVAILNELVELKKTTSHMSEESEESVDDSSDKETPETIKLRKGMILSIAYSASIGGTATMTGTPPNLVMSAEVERAFGEEAAVTFASFFFFGAPTAIVMLILSWIWLQGLFLGWRTLISCCETKTDDDGQADIGRITQDELNKLGKIKFQEVVVLVCFISLVLLWFTRDPKFIPGWSSGFVYTDRHGRTYKFTSDATCAIFMGILLFVLPNEFPDFRSGPKHAILDWKMLQNRMPWDVIFLFGGGVAMARGVGASGLSKWIGKGLQSILGGLPTWLIIIIISTITAGVTEIASNTATATIMLPIVASLAVDLNVHPMLLMYPATIAASFSFMLPAATPPNAVVFASGSLRVMDMAVAGFMLNILGVLVITFSANTYGVYVFDWGSVPACITLPPEPNTTVPSMISATFNSTL